MKKFSLLLIVCCFSLIQVSFSQQNEQSSPEEEEDSQEEEQESEEQETSGLTTNLAIWQAKVPGGEYIVLLKRIVSVSKHRYILDGTLEVEEVNIDTLGDALVRFYFVQAGAAGQRGDTAAIARARQLANRVEDRAGIQQTGAVQKTFPLTSHSKTIEYRLPSQASLEQLYESARNAWLTETSDTFRVGEQ